MNKGQAIADIQAVFGGYKAVSGRATTRLRKLTNGKLYELWVLSEVVQELDARGFRLSFVGRILKFKAGPGKVNLTDGHFTIVTPTGAQLWLFVNIEVQTLGSHCTHVADYSGHHELDIVVLKSCAPYPKYDEVALAVECKCVAKFTKDIIKEVLGVRRELAYFRGAPQDSILTQYGGTPVTVKAKPPSEFWLAYIDPKGDQYDESPSVFGIELKHLQP